MDYITKTLGVPVIRTEWKQQAALPLFLNDRYTFEQADIGGVACLIVHPVGELDTINTLKKHVARLHAASGRQVVFELTAISRQRRNSFIDAKLAFVVPEKQVYLPFLGALLTERCDSEGLRTGAEKLQPSAVCLYPERERAYAHDAFCGAVCLFRNDDHESGKSIGSAWTS